MVNALTQFISYILSTLETGAGGSAPKHVEQLLKENHLRWDSLGEYLATAIGFQELGARTKSANSTLLGDTLMNAVGEYFDPCTKVEFLNISFSLKNSILFYFYR